MESCTSLLRLGNTPRRTSRSTRVSVRRSSETATLAVLIGMTLGHTHESVKRAPRARGRRHPRECQSVAFALGGRFCPVSVKPEHGDEVENRERQAHDEPSERRLQTRRIAARVERRHRERRIRDRAQHHREHASRGGCREPGEKRRRAQERRQVAPPRETLEDAGEPRDGDRREEDRDGTGRERLEKRSVHAPRGNRHDEPEHGHGDEEAPGRRAASLPNGSVGLPGEKRRSVRRERDEREDAHEAGVPVEDSDGLARAEVGEERELEPALGCERNSADQIAERRAEKHGQERAREREKEVPGEAPDWILNVAPEFDRDASQNQTPQDEKDREVEAGYSGGENSREGHEKNAASGQQPDLIAVPE